MGRGKIYFLAGFIFALVAAALGGPYVYLALTNYSEGYRMGVLTKFDSDGYVIKTGEGQLLLGFDSSPLAVDYRTSDGFEVSKDFNPWHFSSSRSLVDRFSPLVGRRVWVRYVEHNYNISFRRTAHQALETGQLAPQPSGVKFVDAGKPFGVGKSEGSRGGRIVKASFKGKVIGTREIVLQMGDAGNQFKPMSVGDDKLYDFAVECLKSGVPVNVHYVDQGILKVNFNDTPFLVYRIELAGS